MATDRPSWAVYGFVSVLLLLALYLGGYFWLGVHGRYAVASHVGIWHIEGHYREFKYDGLRKVFAPLGWAEAKIRGEFVDFQSPGGSDHYEAD